jgi:citrate lyase subunit beta/citryl-CoA lyase
MRVVRRADLPVWRSLLFMPVNVDRYVRKAADWGPDAVVLDLEGSVTLRDKPLARALVAEAASIVSARGADVLVRINRPLDLAVRDIEDVVSHEVAALVVPKVESVGHVRMLSEFVAQVERGKGLPIGHTGFYCVVESASAFQDLFAIAAADPRIVAFGCAAEGLVRTAGAAADPDVLRYPTQQGVIAARAAGVVPLGLFTSVPDFRDVDALRRAVSEARRFGVEGSACVHPSQVPVLNDGFNPTEAERDQALRVLETYQAAHAAGRGSTGLDGRMIDAEAVEHARRLVDVSRRIEAREARKRLGPAGRPNP